jgi:hypothetical protein
MQWVPVDSVTPELVSADETPRSSLVFLLRSGSRLFNPLRCESTNVRTVHWHSDRQDSSSHPVTWDHALWALLNTSKSCW